MTAAPVTKGSVIASRSIPVFVRMLLRGQLTRARMIGLGLLAALGLLIAFAVRRQGEDADAVSVVIEYGINWFLPIACLMLASPMIGNLVDDRLLVYLWLKPVPRWHLPVGAFLALVAVLAPVVAMPIALSGVLAGEAGLAGPAILASLLGVVAYAGFFLWLGARFRWGLWLGIAYVVVWENILARITDGTARLSIRSYLATIVEWGTDVEISLAGRSTSAALLVPIVVGAITVALTARAMAVVDID